MRSILLSVAFLSVSMTAALAEFSDGKVVIGVMGDQSGVVADVGGPGSIVAARMAVAYLF
jgi:branched-chain amino acid transport system substrate-binding protein